MRLMRLSFAVFMLIFIPSSRAAQYQFTNAAWLQQVCSSRDQNVLRVCNSYIFAQADIYFAVYPSCVRPEDPPFTSLLLAKVRVKSDATAPELLAKLKATYIVNVALDEITNCNLTSGASDAHKKNCKDLMLLLGNQWANSYQQQAALELMRNRGCLN